MSLIAIEKFCRALQNAAFLQFIPAAGKSCLPGGKNGAGHFAHARYEIGHAGIVFIRKSRRKAAENTENLMRGERIERRF